MRNLLKNNKGSNTSWFEPYYIYDTVSAFNRTTNTFEPRKRTTAVFFSTNTSILIIHSICSPYDNFSKKKAKGIIHRRFNHYINSSKFVEKVYHFGSIEEYKKYAENTADLIRSNFCPYHFYQETDTDVVPISSGEADIVQLYFQVNYISALYNKFHNVLIAQSNA